MALPPSTLIVCPVMKSLAAADRIGEVRGAALGVGPREDAQQAALGCGDDRARGNNQCVLYRLSGE